MLYVRNSHDTATAWQAVSRERITATSALYGADIRNILIKTTLLIKELFCSKSTDIYLLIYTPDVNMQTS